METQRIDLMFNGFAEIDPARGVLSYKQGPVIKGELAFADIKGFFYETAPPNATLHIYRTKGGKTKKMSIIVTTPERLDAFLNALTAVLPDKQADLRGVTPEEAASRLGLKHAPGGGTKKTMIIVDVIAGIIAIGVTWYFVKKARYVGSAEPIRVTIAQLAASPGKYDGKKVKVTGLLLPGTETTTVTRHVGRRHASSSTSHSGDAGFVPVGWKRDQPVVLFVHTEDEETARGLSRLDHPQIATLVGFFDKDRSANKHLLEAYKKAGVKVDHVVGCISYPPNALMYWLFAGLPVIVFFILFGVSIVVIRRSKTSFA